MIPNNTPTVQKYAAVLTRGASDWSANELQNTYEVNIEVSGTNNPAIVAGDTVFRANRTIISAQYETDNETRSFINVLSMTTLQITLESTQVPQSGDKIYLTIETYNTDL